MSSKFNFKLQKILDLKISIEKEKQEAFAFALLKYEEKVALHSKIKMQKEDINHKLANLSGNKLPASEIQRLSYLFSEIVVAEQAAYFAEREVGLLKDKAFNLFLSARQERLSLEKLREKNSEDWETISRRKEDSMIEEAFAINQFFRKD